MACADPCWAPCGWRTGWTRPSERDRLESVMGTRGRDRPRTHGPGSRHVLRCLAPACTGPGCLSDLGRGAHRVPHPWHSGKGDLRPNLSDTALRTISPFGKTRSYERPAQVCGETRAPRGGRRRPHCRSRYFSRDDRGRQESIAEDRRAAAPRGRGRRYPGSSRRSLTAATHRLASPPPPAPGSAPRPRPSVHHPRPPHQQHDGERSPGRLGKFYPDPQGLLGAPRKPCEPVGIHPAPRQDERRFLSPAALPAKENP